MQTPTLDHQQAHPKGHCVCTPYVLCARCYADLERLRAEQQIREWLSTFGTVADPGAPKRG
jgi:hypothetical protein